ncbi:ribose 5-phosphate isomerase A-domain-containing protein [Vararia minispora EC-137]|uniref:Ribose 5-phosphate isomerase A-domain-containing protein n=1 Tax=Vararia minispora EC-137 TaxID=1314806 RepID=A0ACB8QZM9_9AGAM|nr:ribose 5-phosphate isomerase A-domain-containing protein [Vararia minispora EC-137]
MLVRIEALKDREQSAQLVRSWPRERGGRIDQVLDQAWDYASDGMREQLQMAHRPAQQEYRWRDPTGSFEGHTQAYQDRVIPALKNLLALNLSDLRSLHHSSLKMPLLPAIPNDVFDSTKYVLVDLSHSYITGDAPSTLELGPTLQSLTLLHRAQDRVFIPIGFQSKVLTAPIVRARLQLGEVDQYPTLDGEGAYHLRERVLGEAAVTWVVADRRKSGKVLGTCYKAGIPAKVAPFAYTKLLSSLHCIGSPDAKLRMATHKAGPIVTDNGNFVSDAPFSPESMQNPLTTLTGIVKVGLFYHTAKAAYSSNEDRGVTVRWNDGKISQVAKVSDTPAEELPKPQL